jgi:hypothetical protein
MPPPAHRESEEAPGPPPLELIGYPRLRKGICTALIAPFLFCWPFKRTEREAKAFFIYYVLCNATLVALVLLPNTSSGLWLGAILSVPTIAAIVRFSAALMSLLFDRPVNYNENFGGHVVMMMPCYTEGRDGLEATLDSMATSNLRHICGTIVAVCDGRVIGKGSTESCEDCLKSLMDVHSVTVYDDYTEYMGRYGRMPMFIIAKHKNAGKRDSQIRVFRLINEGRFGQVDCVFMTDAVSAFPLLCVCILIHNFRYCHRSTP